MKALYITDNDSSSPLELRGQRHKSPPIRGLAHATAHAAAAQAGFADSSPFTKQPLTTGIEVRTPRLRLGRTGPLLAMACLAMLATWASAPVYAVVIDPDTESLPEIPGGIPPESEPPGEGDGGSDFPPIPPPPLPPPSPPPGPYDDTSGVPCLDPALPCNYGPSETYEDGYPADSSGDTVENQFTCSNVGLADGAMKCAKKDSKKPGLKKTAVGKMRDWMGRFAIRASENVDTSCLHVQTTVVLVELENGKYELRIIQSECFDDDGASYDLVYCEDKEGENGMGGCRKIPNDEKTIPLLSSEIDIPSGEDTDLPGGAETTF